MPAKKTQPLHTLADLHSLKKTIIQQATTRAETARVLAEQRAEAADAARLFTNTVGKVQAIKPHNTVALPASSLAPIATQRALDEQQVMRDSLSDHFGVEQLLETDDGLSYRTTGISTEVLHKLRRGDWVIQGELDLHGLRVDAARQALTTFIADAVGHGWRCVRVVHGKGLGSKDKQPVLKWRVRTWLVQIQAVLGFVAARPSEGGAGAVVILLAG